MLSLGEDDKYWSAISEST